jgi:transposase
VVRVPSEEEERERAVSRQRGQLVRERQRLQAMGRSLLAMHGIHVTGKWWRGKIWATIRIEAPAWVVDRLKIYIRLI